MADDFGLKIGLEGEKEFKKALSEINQSFKVIGSEMKLVSSEFDKNDTSVKALTARNQVLNKEIEAQKQKIETLRSALQNAAESFGENDRRTQNWQIQLNNAQAALNGMERELENNNKALEDAENGFDEAGDEAENFSKEIDKAGDQSEDAGGKFSKLGEVAKNVGKAMAAAVAAIGTAAIAAGKQLWDMSNDVAEVGDNIDKTSQKIGISAEAYQEWDYVFRRCGSDVNNLQAGMKTLSTVITDAGNGSETAAEKLSAVGLSVEELNGLSQEQQLEKVITALQGMGSGAERTAAATDLLGKSATDMAAVLNTSAEDTAALRQEAEDFGMVMSNEAVAAAATFEDSLTRLQDTMGGLKNRMVGELLPGITQIMDGLSDLAVGNDQAGEEIKNGVTSVIETISALIPQLVDTVSMIAAAVLESAPGIIQAFAQGIIDAIPTLIPVITQVIAQLVTTLLELLPQIIDAGIQVVVSLVQGIAEAVPTLIPQIVLIVTQIVQTLIDNLPMVLDAALQLITGLAQGLLDAIPVLIEALPQIITSIVGFIIGAIPQIIDAGIQLLTSLVAALPEIITAVVEAIPQIIEGLVTAIIGSIPQLIDAGIQLLTSLVAALPEIITAVVEAIPQIIEGLVTAIIGSIPQLIDAGIQLLTSLVSALPEIITAVVEAIPQIIEGLVTAILGSIPQLIDAGVRLLISLIQNLPTIITTVVGAIPQIISGLVTAIIGSIPQIIQAGVELLTSLIKNLPTIIVEIVKAVPQIISGLVSAFGQGVSQLANVGKNLVQGLWNGIQSLASWLWNKVSGWISSIWDGICNFFGIHSPSTEMAWVGKMLVKGLSGSIEDNGDDAVKAAEGMADNINAVMNGLASDMQSAIPSTFDLDATATVGAVTSGTNGLSGFGPLVTVQQMVVRSEEDIRKISQELYNLIQTSSRAQGRFTTA